MISEHSYAKSDLSPSQEKPAEDSRKPLFKVEMGLSTYLCSYFKGLGPLAPHLTWAVQLRYLNF